MREEGCTNEGFVSIENEKTLSYSDFTDNAKLICSLSTTPTMKSILEVKVAKYLHFQASGLPHVSKASI